MHLYFKFLLARILFALIVNCQGYGDEFWQAPEVAHKEVFGYGHLTWEWTVEKPIRSPVYHSFISLFYWLLKVFNWDHDFLVIYGPRL